MNCGQQTEKSGVIAKDVIIGLYTFVRHGCVVGEQRWRERRFGAWDSGRLESHSHADPVSTARIAAWPGTDSMLGWGKAPIDQRLAPTENNIAM